MSEQASFVIICTPDEIEKLLREGKITEETQELSLSVLLDILLEHYGYDCSWPKPSDVY